MQLCILGHEKNVRDVATALLVEVTPLLGQVDSFSGRDVLEVDDGIGHAALGSNDQALEAGGLLSIGLADLRILGDGEIQFVRNRSGPFDGAGNGSAVGDGDDSIAALCGGESRGRKQERQEKRTSNSDPH
jgi:hypothetical protein